jgi:hypothetical protein
MPHHTLSTYGESSVWPLIAQSNRRDSQQALTIQQIRWTASIAAEMKPVQSRAATGFKVRLIPHDDKVVDTARQSKPTSLEHGNRLRAVEGNACPGSCPSEDRRTGVVDWLERWIRVHPSPDTNRVFAL